jgi:hypothetical protein
VKEKLKKAVGWMFGVYLIVSFVVCFAGISFAFLHQGHPMFDLGINWYIPFMPGALLGLLIGLMESGNDV